MRQLTLAECCALRVVAVDPGIHNLGICALRVTGFDAVQLDYAAREDITLFGCGGGRCRLSHTATMADWVDHLLQRHAAAFAAADVVLIERQPPHGFRCCEQLIFRAFRHKARLVAPASLHAHFGVRGLDYDARKRRMVQIATRRFAGSPAAERALAADRAHDVADAMLMAARFAGSEEVRERFAAPQTGAVATDAFFEGFRCRRPPRVPPDPLPP